MPFPYAEKTLTERKAISENIRKKHPNRLPILLRIDRQNQLLKPEKSLKFSGKYIAPEDITIGKFLYEIRKDLNISPEVSVFLFSDNIILSPQSHLLTVYNQHKQEDNFLYLVLASENTFG